MIYKYLPTEEHAELVSLAYGRYDDMRMCWVGRPEHPRNFAITDTDQIVATVCEDRVWIALQNVDAANPIWLNWGLTASVNNSFRLAAGATLILDRFTPWRETIHAVCTAGLTATLCVTDVWQSDMRSGRGA